MRPSLIPHSFTTKNIRKKYHKKRSTRTWMEYGKEHMSYIWLLTGVLFVLFILYVKYSDKKKKNNMAHANNSVHESFATISPTPPHTGFVYY